MCGFAGWCAVDGQPNGQNIAAAEKSFWRRGPDDGGYWNSNTCGLIHRRLSVLDLSTAGHQPMSSPDGRYQIVFNGEIYNFESIKESLSKIASIDWKGHSDTEVILWAYILKGPDCLDEFVGMFAFAIWDEQEKMLFAARDRMGVKPLYFSATQNAIAFSSRPEAIIHLLPSANKNPDIQGLRYYLESGYFPRDRTVYEGIKKLQPGTILTWQGGKFDIKTYWTFKGIAPEEGWRNRREDDLLDELDEIVTNSVRARLISDAPIGAFLSGGIDSSLVVAMMAKLGANPVKTFTIGFGDQAYDESSHAAAVAQVIGTDHRCEVLGVDDLLELLPTFRETFDEPFFDSSAFPTMAVSRLARREVTVALSGDGGDELFGGYHYYEIINKLGLMFKLPKELRSAVAGVVACIPSHKAKLLAGFLRTRDPVTAFAFSRSIAKDYESPLTVDAMRATQGVDDLMREVSGGFAGPLKAAETGMRLDAALTLVDDYLQKVDLATMAFSLEAREPLLDHRLVEWGMRLPLPWKLREGTNKYLLRKLAYRYVPREILDRPKQGFAVPIDRWLRGPLKQWAEDLIYDDKLYTIAPLNPQKVKQLFALHLSGGRNVHPLLWAILMYLDFLRQRPEAY